LHDCQVSCKVGGAGWQQTDHPQQGCTDWLLLSGWPSLRDLAEDQPATLPIVALCLSSGGRVFTHLSSRWWQSYRRNVKLTCWNVGRTLRMWTRVIPRVREPSSETTGSTRSPFDHNAMQAKRWSPGCPQDPRQCEWCNATAGICRWACAVEGRRKRS
jgi:hypothetical protein